MRTREMILKDIEESNARRAELYAEVNALPNNFWRPRDIAYIRAIVTDIDSESGIADICINSGNLEFIHSEISTASLIPPDELTALGEPVSLPSYWTCVEVFNGPDVVAVADSDQPDRLREIATALILRANLLESEGVEAVRQREAAEQAAACADSRPD